VLRKSVIQHETSELNSLKSVGLLVALKYSVFSGSLLWVVFVSVLFLI